MANSAGTVNYMAPEQLKRQKINQTREYRIGKKADVWALGCILHYMAYSETPYHSITDQRAKMMAICDKKAAVPIKSGTHSSLTHIFLDCFVKDFMKRASIRMVVSKRRRFLNYNPDFILQQLTVLRT